MRATYLPKKIRKALDRMIAHVCDFPEGQNLAGMEVSIEHDDGEWDTVTILVVRGEWYDFIQDKTIERFEWPDFVPPRWEGSE